MPKKINDRGLWWQLLEKAKREILEQAILQHGRGAPEALGITRETFFKKARDLGVKYNPPGPSPRSPGKKWRRRKPTSLYSWVSKPVDAYSEPSGSASPPRAELPAGTPLWLINAAKHK